MTITVQGPGFSVEFPDGTDDATINKQMSIANAQFKAAQKQGDASGDVSVGSGADVCDGVAVVVWVGCGLGRW